jgi:hypothetical protein
MRFIRSSLAALSLLVASAAALHAQAYPSATVGVPWLYQPGSTGVFEVFGGARLPYTQCRITSGSLPPGFTFALSGGTCYLSGTPTTAGSYTFQFTITDSTPITTSPGTVQITVNPAPLITSSALGAGVAGTSYSTALQKSGGTSPFLWAVTAGAFPLCQHD